MKKAADATPNLLLVAARLQRHWTQQAVAERIETTVVNVSRWERGHSIPGAYFRYCLCSLFGQSAVELGLEVGPEQDRKPCQHMTYEEGPASLRLWHVPFPRNPLFTGRDAVLQRLHHILHTRPSALTLPCALSGLGGIGKTQTALEYAYRFGEAYSDVLWVSGERRDRLLADCAALAHTLCLVQPEEREQTQTVARMQQWLSEHSGWLLILDNVDDLTLMQEVLPAFHSGRVLLTTRTQITGTLAQCLALDGMNQDEGALFLLRRAKLISVTAQLGESPVRQRAAAREVAHLMEGLPLALDQAGAYLEETRCDLYAYLQHYQSRQLCLLKRRGEPVVEHPDSVEMTFALAIEQVKQANPTAADLLCLCAFLHPDAIPEEILMADLYDSMTMQQAGEDAAFVFDEAIKNLRRFSLVQRHRETRQLTIHRLVQAVLRDGMDKATQRLWSTRAVCAVHLAFPAVVEDNWPQCERYLSHALASATLITQWNMQFPAAARLLHRTGVYLVERGQYTQAERLLHSALSIHERILEAEHPDIAEGMNDLAIVLHHLGKYAQAELLYQKALHIWEKTLGAEHLELAHGLNNLAFLNYEQGHFDQAEPLYQRALHIREQALGPNHSQVAESLNNLAALYREVGRYTRAKQLYQRALVIREQILGAEHPLVAQSLNGLARLYHEQGHHTLAEPLYQRALVIREQELGPEHPRVALCLNNLAELYLAKGHTAQAQPLAQRSLAIRERALGQEHPDVAQSLNTLAELYLSEGSLTQAEITCQRSLAIYKKVLGTEHPRIVHVLKTLAALYCKQGKCLQAETCLQNIE